LMTISLDISKAAVMQHGIGESEPGASPES
jgi:hypothetical protein